MGSFRQLEMEYKMGMRLILFFTDWKVGYLKLYKFQGLREGKWTNVLQIKNAVIRILHFMNQSVKILPQIPRLRFWYPSIKFDHEKKLEDIEVFSVIRLEVEVNFFIGMFLKVLIFLVPVIGNDNPVSLQISYRK